MIVKVRNVDRLGLERYNHFGFGTISASGTNIKSIPQAEQTA